MMMTRTITSNEGDEAHLILLPLLFLSLPHPPIPHIPTLQNIHETIIITIRTSLLLLPAEMEMDMGVGIKVIISG